MRLTLNHIRYHPCPQHMKAFSSFPSSHFASHPQGAFLLYMGLALIGMLLFTWILPETKGKSLEQVIRDC